MGTPLMKSRTPNILGGHEYDFLARPANQRYVSQPQRRNPPLTPRCAFDDWRDSSITGTEPRRSAKRNRCIAGAKTSTGIKRLSQGVRLDATRSGGCAKGNMNDQPFLFGPESASSLGEARPLGVANQGDAPRKRATGQLGATASILANLPEAEWWRRLISNVPRPKLTGRRRRQK